LSLSAIQQTLTQHGFDYTAVQNNLIYGEKISNAEKCKYTQLNASSYSTTMELAALAV
jgi:uncharacterized protein Smg (DUF494 family)